MCIEIGCSNKVHARGYCYKHYRKHLRKGDIIPRSIEYNELCSIGGCNNPNRSKGLCNKHYIRLRRNGSTEKKQIKRGRKDYMTTGIEGGEKTLQVIKTASYGLGVNVKQFVRDAINYYIKEKFDIDISLLEQPLKVVKKQHDVTDIIKLTVDKYSE